MIWAMLGESWRAMGANRLRTLLTMLGMVIGVGAVVLMMSIGQGAQYSIQQSISAMGSNLFILLSGSNTAGGVRSGSGGGYTLTVADAEAIAELPGVQVAAPIHPGSAQIIYGPNNWNTSIIGSTPDYLEARSWPIVSGSGFTNSDVRSATRVALIGKTAAQNLFGDDDPVGKTIRIRQSPFVVLGVLATKGQGMDGRDQDDTIIIPLTTAQRKVFGSQFQGAVRMMMVQTTTQEIMPVVEKSMTELLRQRHRIREGMDNDFFLRNLTAVADSAAESTRVMSLLLGAIASISLLVGGIGIMNIMLASVMERVREIGTRQAIGASRKDIVVQFLAESTLISVSGGIIGIVLGVVLSKMITAMFDIKTIISFFSIFIAFGVSALVGILFGYMPAKNASEKDPVESLRA